VERRLTVGAALAMDELGTGAKAARASLAGSVRHRVRHAVVPQLAAGLARCPGR